MLNGNLNRNRRNLPQPPRLRQIAPQPHPDLDRRGTRLLLSHPSALFTCQEAFVYYQHVLFTSTSTSSTDNNTFSPSSSISTSPSSAPQRPGLQIPEYKPNGSAPNSYSPLEGLQVFLKRCRLRLVVHLLGLVAGYALPNASFVSCLKRRTLQQRNLPHQTQTQPQIPTPLIAAYSYAHHERVRSDCSEFVS